VVFVDSYSAVPLITQVFALIRRPVGSAGEVVQLVTPAPLISRFVGEMVLGD
jgi:hypothetical protein